MKNSGWVVTAIIAILLAWNLGFLGILFSLLNPSYPQELTNFTNINCKTSQFDFSTPFNVRECQYEGTLQGEENAENVTLQVGLKTVEGASVCDIEAKAEVFNQVSGVYEEIWSFSKNFGEMNGLSFIKSDADVPDYYSKSGECWIYSNYLCKRKEISLNSAYINNGAVKFRTTLTSTCNGQAPGNGNAIGYDMIQVGYSDWQISGVSINQSGEEGNNTVVEIDENTTVNCPSGYTYNSITDKCEYYPSTQKVCTEGTYNPTTDKCELSYQETPPLSNFLQITLFEIGNYEVKVWLAGIVLLVLLALLLGGRR